MAEGNRVIARATQVRDGAALPSPRSAVAIIDATLNHPVSMAHPAPRLSGLHGETTSRLNELVQKMLDAATPVSRAKVAYEIRSQLGMLPLVARPLGRETLRDPEFHAVMASLDRIPQSLKSPSKQAALIVAVDQTALQDARIVIASIVTVPAFEGRGHEAQVLDALCSYADQQNMEIVVRDGAIATRYDALLREHGFAKDSDGVLIREKREPQAFTLRVERGGDSLNENDRHTAMAESAVMILDAADHDRVQTALERNRAGERALVGADRAL